MATAFVAILALGLLAAAGLVHDGGQILATYREAGDLASAAARAGAQAVDPAALRAGNVSLDGAQAEALVNAFLADAGHAGAGAVAIDADGVTVTVTLVSDGHLLLPGAKEVQATASATPTAGVDQARPGS